MTAIAIKNGIIAADSCMSGSACERFRTTKLMRLGGIAWAGAGSLGDFQAFVFYLKTASLPNKFATGPSGFDPSEYEFPALRYDQSVVVAYDGTHVIEFTKTGHPIIYKPDMVAFGCPDFLMGAMRAGATAQMAVDLACRHVEGCGGPVIIEDMRS